MIQIRNGFLKLERSSVGLLNNKPTLLTLKSRQQTQAAASEPTPTIPETNVLGDWHNARPFEEIPTDKAYQLVLKYLPGGKYYKKDMSKVILGMRDEHGDIHKLPAMPGLEALVTTHNPRDFERVYRSEGVWPRRQGMYALNYHRSEHRADFYQGVEGLLATQDKVWGEFRSIVNPVLMQTKNVRLYYKKMSQVNRDFIDCIKDIRDPSTLEVPANFEEYINRWTLESVSVVALDKQLGLLKGGSNEAATKLCNHMNVFFELGVEIESKPSLWRYYATPLFKKLMTAFDGIQQITLGFVNEAIERLDAEAKSGIVRSESEQSVLEKLLKIDKKVATVMAMDMLMAGVDTTTSTFAGLMLSIAKNPEKQAKLREEVLRILPEKNSEFTEDSIKQLSYLRACIKEAMRMYPPTIANVRTTQQDCVLSGYQVPKGTSVLMIPITLINNEKYFARPNEYLPERWLRTNTTAQTEGKCPASTNELKATDPFVFLPFGFGPRMCVGKRIVDLELELGLARIIRNFYVEFNHSTENAFKPLLLNKPNIPLKFKFIDVE